MYRGDLSITTELFFQLLQSHFPGQDFSKVIPQGVTFDPKRNVFVFSLASLEETAFTKKTSEAAQNETVF